MFKVRAGFENPEVGIIRTLKLQVSDVWQYKELVIELFRTFIKLRHVGSVLGVLWTLLNPAFYIAAYWLVFTQFVKMGMHDYPLFLIPGFLAWNFTFGALVSATESISQSQYLTTKIAFPNEILPLVNVAVPMFDFIVSIMIYLLVSLLIPGFQVVSSLMLMLPFILLLQFMITLGLGFILATISVYFRDVPKLVQLAGTVLFFLTPVFYPVTYIPEKWQFMLKFHPVAQVITYYQDIFYYHKIPSASDLLLTSLIASAVLLSGMLLFNRYKKTFAELT